MAGVVWGVSDFLGGTWSRRLAPIAVVGFSEGLAFLAILVIAGATGHLDDPLGYLPWALAAGVAGLMGVTSFYTALATGTMGVVAPIAAVGVVVPVAVGLAQGEQPTVLEYVGALATVIGVVLASGPELRNGRGARPVMLAFVAAGGFGLALTFIAEGSDGSVPMTLLVMRGVVVVILGALALATRSVGGVRPADGPRLFLLGGCDLGANAAYSIATTSGLVSLSAVLASLYPAVTVVLARLVHGERMRRAQDVGVVLTLAGVALIASGGGTG